MKIIRLLLKAFKETISPDFWSSFFFKQQFAVLFKVPEKDFDFSSSVIFIWNRLPCVIDIEGEFSFGRLSLRK